MNIRLVSRKDVGEGVWRMSSDVRPFANEEVLCYTYGGGTYFDYTLSNGEWRNPPWGEDFAWQYIARPFILD
jgi:hypothetical protein